MCRFINFDDTDNLTENLKGLTDKNLFAYCGNNPAKNKDSNGNFFETVLDFASLMCSASQMHQNHTLANFGFFEWDVAAFCVQCLPGSYVLKGFEVAGIVKNTTTIIMNRRRRIPDAYYTITKTLEEVKNVKKFSLTRQLRDDMEYCKVNDFSMILYLRPNTYIRDH